MKVLDREGHGGKLTMEDGCKIDDSVEIDTSCDVTLGSHVSISDGAAIYTHDHLPEDITRKRFSPLVIGDYAWIAARAIILESCQSIGEGAVIGAGSVVTHSVPAHELWAGNPARFIRRLGE